MRISHGRSLRALVVRAVTAMVMSWSVAAADPGNEPAQPGDIAQPASFQIDATQGRS
jgi:hypothetical protein